jgi:ferritin
MSFTDGYIFGFLRRRAIEERKHKMDMLEFRSAQVDALKEVIATLVPEHDSLRDHVNPLYRKLLKKECIKRNIPSPV